MITGNLFPVIAGYLLASGCTIHLTLIWTIIGASLVMASGCVFNNCVDRDIDLLMERTKNRPLATKTLSPQIAVIFGFILGIVGMCVLYFYTNKLAAHLGAFGLFAYVILYTILSKRRSVFSTHIGSISGATPPLIGYCAASGVIDSAGIALFFLLAAWQMPHFFAIAIFREKDFAAASIPTIFSKLGIRKTKISMLRYVIIFTAINLSFSILGYTGIVHMINASLIGSYWIHLAISGFKAPDDLRWARKMFFTSIAAMVLSCITIAIS